MFRRTIAFSSLAGFALVGSLFVPGIAPAQQGRHLYEWSGNWGQPRSQYQDYANRSGPGGYTGGYYTAPSFTPSFPAYSSFAPAAPAGTTAFYYGTPSFSAPAPYSYAAAPTFSSGPSYYGSDTSSQPQAGSFYGALGTSNAMNQPASINVRVPADATIRFNGSETSQKGAFRQFVSPPLAAGREYTYDVQARWNEGGKDVTRNRRVTVRPGETVDVSFNDNAGK